MSTFSHRDGKVVQIAKIDGGTVTWSDGWSTAAFADIIDQLDTHTEYLLETRNFSLILGLAVVGRPSYNPSSGFITYGVVRWLSRKSDEDLEREHEEMTTRFAREREAQWAEHHDDWARREQALPSPLRRRLDRFRANGGHEFEVNGWGYELIASELAVLYAASGGKDDEAVEAFARAQGTSGNQHDFAKLLARHLTDDLGDHDVVANAVSALSPLTGDADYSQPGRS
jgi:hypothetical protein